MLKLLSGAINYKNVIGGQENDLAKLEALREQQASANQYKELEFMLKSDANSRANAEYQLKARGIHRSAPYEVNGKRVIDWTDATGQIVNREVVGAATTAQGKTWFKLPDGSIRAFSVLEAPPLGSTKVSDNSDSVNAQRDFMRETKLASVGTKIDEAIANGDEEKVKTLIQFFNAQSPDYQYQMKPGAHWWNRDSYELVPKTGVPTAAAALQGSPEGEFPQPIHTPQTVEEFNALPKGSIYIDPDDGKKYRK